MKTRICGAHVVLPTETSSVDVIVQDATIADLDPAPQVSVDRVIDARGRWLLPGVIDDQVHFREPGLTHKEDLATATRACAKGGVTSFLEMPNTQPATVSRARLEEKLRLASQKSLVNYGFYLGATGHNLSELQRVERTPGIKIFIGSSTGDLLVDDQEVLEAIFATTSLPITAHCEDEATICANRDALGPIRSVADHSRIRDERAALIATRRAIDLAKRHGHRFHLLHVSTAVETELVIPHEGLITAEVCPHHLFFNVNDYERLGSLIQMNPSVKTAADNQGLWNALMSGRVQVIATDHAPHTWTEKQLPYPRSPSGLPAVENSLALLLNEVCRGRCQPTDIARWMCDAPARVWDMIGKGRIAVGYDADLVLVDLQKTHTIRHENQLTKCRWTPWHGVTLTGWPVRTWVRGQEVFADGQVIETVRGSEIQYDKGRGGYWATVDY